VVPLGQRRPGGDEYVRAAGRSSSGRRLPGGGLRAPRRLFRVAAGWEVREDETPEEREQPFGREEPISLTCFHFTPPSSTNFHVLSFSSFLGLVKFFHSFF
jgi:hypothetical protein